MAHLNQPPVTPQKQLHVPPAVFNLDSPIDDVECTPYTKSQMVSLKRKASQHLSQSTPILTSSYLQWRLATIRCQLDLNTVQKKALLEASSTFEENKEQQQKLAKDLRQTEKRLSYEKAWILSNHQTLEEDLNDVITDQNKLTDAYVNELRMSYHASSSLNERLSGLKSPRLNRKTFQRLVNEYLGTKFVNLYPDGSVANSKQTSNLKWCNVLGFWLGSADIKCAHIVPHSFNSKDLAYIFGGDETPLTSPRNGFSLQIMIEEAFDKSWITIVPADSVESIPTEWKVILLKDDIKENIFYQDRANITNQRIWRWKDIDGRTLKFLNSNRPARRFLYLRYTMAWLDAEEFFKPDFKQKVPSGTVWASPNKPDGYLRKSILVELGRRTGGKLPDDLIQAGIFEDPDTSTPVLDELANTRFMQLVRGRLDSLRDPKAVGESDKESHESGEETDEETDDED
jgi:hypothetical protein